MAARPSHTFAFAISGPIARDDLPGLCDRVCSLLEGAGAAVALCDGCATPRRSCVTCSASWG
jgi:hypothetical protein